MDTQAIKQSLLKKFSEVTADRLQKIQLAAIQLEKSENDIAADNVAHELHTMKGEARILGLAAIAPLPHDADDLLNPPPQTTPPPPTPPHLLSTYCYPVPHLALY